MRMIPFALFAITAVVSAEEPKRAGPDWWAIQPARAAKLPANVNPVDHFIDAKLTSAGFKPAGEADRLTLIRRATFDLIGLPPTPAEIDAFVADRSPKAFEKLIDRLLASSAYGERWARHWLDVVRFSESHGFEYDRLRDNAWPYRDYVIRSLNADKPYATFVREQLAGDVLADSPDGLIATGVLVAGPFDQAGAGSVSAIIRGRAREDELEDMLGMVGQTFLGVTVNCARCHDHKFDPYSAKDYYRLRAVFAGVTAGERSVATKAETAKVADLERQVRERQDKIDSLERTARGRLRKDREPGVADVKLPRPIARWTFDADGRDSIGELHATLKDGAKLERGRLIVDGQKAFAATGTLGRDLGAKTLEAWVALPRLDQGGGGVISIQAPNGSMFDAIVYAERTPKRWMAGSEGFVRTRDLAGPDETAKPIELVHVAIAYAADGRIAVYRNGRPYAESYVPPEPLKKFRADEAQVVFGMRHTGGGRPFFNGEIDEARLYDSALSPEQVLASFRAGVERVSPDELKAALTETERRDHALAETELRKLRESLVPLQRPRLAYAVNPKPIGATTILRRGDSEKPGAPVTPGSPEIVKGPPPCDLPANASEGERRRAFAEWVVHADNPLTWRVIVNRVWQHHFGEGLVRTPNDFGLNGDPPTHPELLDALAIEFQANGGSLKALHKRIMLSAAYRRASTFDPKAAELDADNRLLWRFAPRRLEAEAVRDAMLATSGKLNREAGGPSTRPFKIETFNSAFYVLFDDERPEFNRRSVYRMNVNSAKDPVLDVLDCPDPSVKTPRRNATTTPLQALTLMNNPFANRMAASFAERLVKDAGPDANAQVTLAYRLALGRPPTDAERDRAIAVVREAGLKAVCWAMFNASEFVYVK